MAMAGKRLSVFTDRFVTRLERFAYLAAEDKAAVLTSLSPRERHAARTMIVDGQTSPPGAHLILSGMACRYISLPSGQRQILGYLLPGDIFNARAALIGRTYHAIGTLSPVETALISTESLTHLLTRYPALLHAIYSLSARDDAITRQWLLNTGHRTAFERLAHMCCEVFERLREVGLISGNACAFPITQPDLADALALTPVHVNRTLKRLRQAGYITLEHRTLTILDLPGLQSIAGFNPDYLQQRSLPSARELNPAQGSPAQGRQPLHVGAV